jgi:hypothetical protein
MAEQNTSPTNTRRTQSTASIADTNEQTRAARSQDSGPRTEENGPQQPSIIDRVKDSATGQLASQKDRGVDAIGSVAQAIRSSTQKLRDDKHDIIATYLDKAAEEIENWSHRVREKDVDELIGDVQRLARRQPAVFIGSAFAVGLVGARFLKSSRQQNDDEYSSESRRAQYGGGRFVRSSALDVGPSEADRAEPLEVVDEVVITEATSPMPQASTSSAGAPSGRSRRSSSGTENS